jgi:hypothetical protein
MRVSESKWFLPIFSVGLGLVFLVGQWIGGSPGSGLASLGIIHATALSGLAVIIAVIIGAAVELARGNSGAPFAWLGAIGGIAYLIAVVALRLRG